MWAVVTSGGVLVVLQVEEESKPEVVHVPSNLNLLKKDDVLKEGEIVMVSERHRSPHYRL